ncbi:hypothetical protein VZQ01_05810 [Myxococcus faecalis]|uniref:hypothetical protein n=1 Tax=Myxococcus faecalis TaxID=3115646 RepID=UPI003CFB2FA6
MAEVKWTASSQHHDWNDRRAPAAFIDALAEAGLVGTVEGVCGWDEDATRRAVKLQGPGVGARVMAEIPKKEKHPFLKAWGSTPSPWTLTVGISRFVADEGRVAGLNTFVFQFDGAAYEDEAGSALLLAAFHAAHSPDTTEFAAIHPLARYEALETGEYDSAVTLRPLFAGVFWANFLGRGHVEQFDRAVLARLPPERVEWVDGGKGLFVVTTPRLGEATTPAVEAEMQRLTEVFREARRR